MEIRLLRPGDEDLLRQAESEFYPDDPPTPERCAALLREPTFVMAVALSDAGDVISRIYGHVLHRPEATDFLIYEVDTADDHKRKGAARAIVEFLKVHGRGQGWREMWVLTDPAEEEGDPFYRAVGGELESRPNMFVFRL